MHNRVYNELTIRLTITPTGPVLVKSGEEASDPRRPDMSFVRTFSGGRRTVYLPGSSLKGVLRSHCERLARTVDSDERRRRNQGRPLACNPVNPPEKEGACAGRIKKKIDEEKEREQEKWKNWSGARKHAESCFLCRMFGNTSVASHFQITDAHPSGDCRTEERNGVAIDRVYGSVAVGPFNYETVTEGEFRTTLRLKNFTLSQTGLLLLALRDLSMERVRLGFAKSRGLGLVGARVEELTLGYPLCELDGEKLNVLGRGEPLSAGNLYGVGHFVGEGEGYGYPKDDKVELPAGYEYSADEWMGVELRAPGLEGGGADWKPLGQKCVPRWRAEVENVGRS
jgi:CRISPR/Cas system CSM-associated protein Csm3 (group 7 of RAMP superfamily)